MTPAISASGLTLATSLGRFLDDTDYEALADGPLAGAMAAYRRTEGRTTAVVWVVVFVMLAAAAMEAGWINPDALRS